MSDRDPIDAAIEAATVALAQAYADSDRTSGMSVAYLDTDGYKSFRLARAPEAAAAAIRAAAPILIQHGRELAAEAIEALGVPDNHLAEHSIRDVARIARGGQS